MRIVTLKSGLMASCAVCAVGASPAFGQVATETEASVPPTDNVIIVTAQKREQNLQDVPVAITAISGQALTETGVEDLRNLQTAVPGLQVGESFGTARVNIRGISNENLTIGGDPGVALHFNGVYAARPEAALGSFFDLERIEVLRGPQGTLYGRNASGGSVNVVFARPTSSLEGYAYSEVANFGSFSGEAAFSGPIAESLSGRVSGRFATSDGYTENLADGFGDLDDQGEFALRGQLLWEPDGPGSAHLIVGYADQATNGPSQKLLGSVRGNPLPFEIDGGILPPADEYAVFSDTGSFDKRQTFFTTLETRLDLDFAELVWLTDYRELDIDFNFDVDTTSLNDAAETTFATNSQQISSEVRLQGANATLDWVVGAYYLSEEADQRITVRFGPFSAAANPLSSPVFAFPLPETIVDLGGQVDTTSFALFGQADWRPLDDLVVTFGIRQTWDERRGTEFNNQLLVPFGSPGRQIEGDFSETSGKLGIQYFFTDDVNVYATASRGFKSGGLNIGTLQDPFDAETVWAYEAGLKSLFANDSIRLNLVGFYYDYSDLQVQQIEGFSTVIRNAADAEVMGVEAELGVTPMTGLTFEAAVSWLDATFENFQSVEEAFPELGLQDLSENRLANTPEFTVRIAGEYEFPISSAFDLALAGSYYWQDDVFFSPFNRPVVGQEDYERVDVPVRLSHRPSQIDVIAFVENATDELVLDNITVTAAITGSGLQASLAPPRRYGLRVRKVF